MQPSFTIKLIDETLDDIFQLDTDTTRLWGSSAGNAKVGQTFKAPSNIGLFKVIVDVLKVGAPTDDVIIKLYASDKSTLIETSSTIISGSDLTTGFLSYIFIFDLPPLTSDTTYFLEVSRSGSVDGSNYYGIAIDIGNPYADGSHWIYITDTWTDVPTQDLKFELFFKTIVEYDILEDVREISNINTGLNGVYGAINQGDSFLTLTNDDSKYSPLNDSSTLFGKFRVNNKIKIIATYDSINYSLFTGIIVNIEPLLEDRVVNVRLLDLFSRFAETEVSIGTTSGGETADELIELLLQAAGLVPAEYSLDADLEGLLSVNWDNVNLLEKLNDIVAAGQHYHYIDGDGIYIFKNNQWLSDNTPLFTYEAADPDTAKQQYKLEDIRNKITVHYNTTSTIDSEDEESQDLFGERVFILENDLLDDVDYAQFIADYILRLKKDAGNIIEMDLSITYPDIFKINFGDAIRIIEPFHNIDDIYNILEKKHTLPNTANNKLAIVGRKFVFPPDVGVVILEPFQDDADIAIPGSSVFGLIQGFKVANDGEVLSADFKMIMDISDNFSLLCRIYELDGSGFPTGGSLAISNRAYIFNAPGFDGIAQFTFPEVSRPLLVTTTQYGFTIDFAGTPQGKYTNLKMRGKTSDVYANGKPAYFPTPFGPWTTLHPNEFYFKAVIKEI